MKKKQKKKKKYRVFWFFIKLQIVLIVLVLAAVAFYYFSGYGGKVSALQKEAKQLVHTSTEDTFRAVETSLVYAADGQLISTLKGEKDVYYLEFEDIPVYAKAAIVSIEDKKFYTHNGIDLKAILRAAKALIENGEVTQGGSTITQQLARNVFLSQEKTWQRKVEEIFIAVELEKIYSKDQILEFYLNNVYFGNGYYGIEAASKGYFNQDVRNLNLSQIAFLCGIPNSPTRYDPVEHLDAAVKRRDRILKNMLEDSKISTKTYEEAIAVEIVLDRPVKTKNDYVETYTYYCATRALMEQQGFQFQTQFATDAEQEAYQEEYNELYSVCQKSLYQKGYRIYTTIDLSMQQQLQQSVDSTLSEYTEVSDEGVYTLQSSAVCIDNHTGYVKAIVGGRSQDMTGYTLNRAYQSFRQPGSAIKPLLVYTPALERGYTPDSTVVDEEIEDGPKNANGVFEGAMSLRQAVQKSRNTIAWKLLEEITPAAGLSYLKEMNFSKLKPEDEHPAAALGGFTTGASALEMASGYAAIQNDGKYRAPTCVSAIMDSEGEMVYSPAQTEKQVYQENAARMMTDMLKDVVTDGTGRGLALTNMPSAGKTGTTNDNKDGWFVGYTRYYTTSVWVGYDMPRELTGLSGSSYPGSIWYQFMEAAHTGLDPMEFIPYIQYDAGSQQPVTDPGEEEVPQEPEEPQPEVPQIPEEPQEPEIPPETDPGTENPPEQTPELEQPDPGQTEEPGGQNPGEETPPEEEPPEENDPEEGEKPGDETPPEDGGNDSQGGDSQEQPEAPPKEDEYTDKNIM